MSLSEDQIQQLYKFTRAHFVEHYDLQTELVDHLANGIEHLREEDPKLSFQEALNKEFKKFGVCGFSDVIKEKRKAMGKQYRSFVWHFFKQWFQWPKLLLTLGTFGFFSLLLIMLNGTDTKSYVFFGLLLILALLPLGYLIVTRKNRELDMVRDGRKWLLSEFIYKLGDMFQIPALIFQIVAYGYNAELFALHSITFNLVFAALITVTGIANYIVLFVIPSKAEELLKETYPEYALV